MHRLGRGKVVGLGVHGATVSRIDRMKDPFAEYILFYRAFLQKRPIILFILAKNKNTGSTNASVRSR